MVVNTAPLTDHNLVGIIEVNIARQFLWRGLIAKTDLSLFLEFGQKFNRHGGSLVCRWGEDDGPCLKKRGLNDTDERRCWWCA